MADAKDKTFRVLEVLAIIACLINSVLAFIPKAEASQTQIAVLGAQVMELTRRVGAMEKKLDDLVDKR